MLRPVRAALVLALLLAPGRPYAGCGDDPGDAQEVADARAQVAGDCDCRGTTHATYVRCAAHIANDRVAVEQLRPQCRKALKRCAARSTCGRPGAITCCRTDARGRTRCTIKRDQSACHSSPGGAACTGPLPCCPACAESGCAPSSTTSTTSSSTSTTTAATLVRAPCTGGSSFPTCGGACSGSDACGLDVDFDPSPISTCSCFSAGVTPCGASAYPQCGGVCFGDHVCQAFHVGPDVRGDLAFCGCVAPDSDCVPPAPRSCAGPGRCSSGYACRSARIMGQEFCDCGPP